MTHRSSQLPHLSSNAVAPRGLGLIPRDLVVDPAPREPRQRLLLLPQRLCLPRNGLGRPVDLADGALQLGLVAREGRLAVRGGGAKTFETAGSGEGREAGFS
ncbi:hypothetical protein IMZ48_14135 [Candidatus Bathyarchaeota archaeon]|nr:hypothetical protein [Candidatus Bathyarchaeota archaeon]